jgi:hypothetical protein
MVPPKGKPAHQGQVSASASQINIILQHSEDVGQDEAQISPKERKIFNLHHQTDLSGNNKPVAARYLSNESRLHPIDRMFQENEKYKQYHQEVQANKKLKRDPNSPAVPPISQKELLDDLQKQIRERQKQMLII